VKVVVPLVTALTAVFSNRPQGFPEANVVGTSYKKKGEVQNIDNYKIDNDLSTRRNKVYTNDKGEAVLAISGTDNLKDWSNNLLIPFGLHAQTDRYKSSEETLKKTNAKYGKQKVSVVL